MNKFEILQKLHVSRELQLKVETVVLDCLDKAQAKFGVDKVQKIPKIRYNTKGTYGGKAYWNGGDPYIDINPILLNENVEYVVNQTVPHEVAHVVVFEVYGTGKNWFTGRRNVEPHGYEWQSVMRLFGKEPDRCHDMDTTTIRKIKNGGVEYMYKCKCMIHKLTKIKHNRFQNGVRYHCAKCRTKLVFDKIEKV